MKRKRGYHKQLMTPERYEKIKLLIGAGLTAKQISGVLGCGNSTVFQIIHSTDFGDYKAQQSAARVKVEKSSTNNALPARGGLEADEKRPTAMDVSIVVNRLDTIVSLLEKIVDLNRDPLSSGTKIPEFPKL